MARLISEAQAEQREKEQAAADRLAVEHKTAELEVFV